MTNSENYDGAIQWSQESHIQLPEGHNVRVLQREVPNVDTFRMDVAPLFELSASWLLKDQSGITRTEGKLLEYAHRDGDDIYLVDNAPSTSSPWQAALPGVRARKLIVWRLNDNLEMLQFRVGADQASLYIQAGGHQILAIMLDLATRNPTDQHLVRCMSLYETGVDA